LLVTGVMSALMVLGTIFLLPKLGAGKLFLLQIVGQICMALIVSHFGLFDSAPDPINAQKIIGAAFLVVGAIITVVRF
jgi:transporter family-2 protein